jgi:Fe-S cluster assembly protein SufD
MKQIILDLQQNYHKIEITEDTEIYGLFVGKGVQKIVSKLDVIHKKPNLVSNTTIKAVVYDQSKFDMEGNLVIDTGAKNTDAYLRIDVLIMDSSASARAVPSLEITEDSVKGGHGATVGEIDKEQLFYLRSRGLSEDIAKQTLAEGFIKDIRDKMKNIKE